MMVRTIVPRFAPPRHVALPRIQATQDAAVGVGQGLGIGREDGEDGAPRPLRPGRASLNARIAA